MMSQFRDVSRILVVTWQNRRKWERILILCCAA